MIIEGLTYSNYLINNRINLLVYDFTNAKHLIVEFTNTYTNRIATLKVYPINNTFKFDISGFVKSTFIYPNSDLQITINKIDIKFTLVFLNNTTEIVEMQKAFIRGGNNQGVYADLEPKRNYLPNAPAVELLITNKTPIWSADITTAPSTQLSGGEFTVGETTEVERLDVPCKGIKVMFLNQYGTYSFWYFNYYEINDKTKHIGVIGTVYTDFLLDHFNNIGSHVETSITVKDNVPLRFNELIRHLVVSMETYVYFGTEQIRVSINNSKWVFNSKENTYKHSITFDFANVLNPSDIC